MCYMLDICHLICPYNNPFTQVSLLFQFIGEKKWIFAELSELLKTELGIRPRRSDYKTYCPSLQLCCIKH